MHWAVSVAPIGVATFLALLRKCRALLAGFLLMYAAAFSVHEAAKREADPVLHEAYQSGLTRFFLAYAARSLGAVLVVELLFGNSIPRCVALPSSQLVVFVFTATHTHEVSFYDRLAVAAVGGIAFAGVFFRDEDRFRRSFVYSAWALAFFVAQNAPAFVWHLLVVFAVWTL